MNLAFVNFIHLYKAMPLDPGYGIWPSYHMRSVENHVSGLVRAYKPLFLVFVTKVGSTVTKETRAHHVGVICAPHFYVAHICSLCLGGKLILDLLSYAIT